MVPFHRNFNRILRRDHKKIHMSDRLWVGRRKEPILGYVLKNYEKKNLVLKGLMNQSLWWNISGKQKFNQLPTNEICSKCVRKHVC